MTEAERIHVGSVSHVELAYATDQRTISNGPSIVAVGQAGSQAVLGRLRDANSVVEEAVAQRVRQRLSSEGASV